MARPPLRILFTAAELTPLAKVGGLADVVGALPKALTKLGVDVRIVIPKYGIINASRYPMEKIRSGVSVSFLNRKEGFNIFKTHLPETTIPVYCIDHPELLGQNGVYVANDASSSGTLKECRRFTFFSRSILELFDAVGWWPDLVHAHDWHVGILPVLLKIFGKKDQRFSRLPILLTIHNLAYQGKYHPQDVFSSLGITEEAWPTLKRRFGDKQDINYLEQAVLNADLINTVSPTYAKEILTAEYGEGLEKILLTQKNDLFGILNGIDVERLNPEGDPWIAQHYNVNTLEKKLINKKDLEKILGFSHDRSRPILGMVSRLTNQKGVDLLLSILRRTREIPVRIVVLGQGTPSYEESLIASAKKHPQSIVVKIAFDAVIAQKIYAGSDFLLIPSRFEPCGLTQMIAMRYGTVPIVRATGGLKDTVCEWNSKTQSGTGFFFKPYNAQSFFKTIERAINIFQRHPKQFRKLQENGMRQDFSWTKSAKRYMELYEKIIKP